MNVMIPVRPDGSVEPRFGKAPMVAVAQVDNDGHVTDWHTFKVEWEMRDGFTASAPQPPQSDC